MNRSTLLIVACGFFFALIAAVAVQMIGGKGKKDEPIAQARTTQILVAAKDLKIGEQLTPGSTQWAQWPEGSVFTGAIVREGEQSAGDALKGRTKRIIVKGEPIQKSAMIDDTKSNFIAASLEPGMRAVSVNVSAQTAVAGFVSPGDRVDVILTYDVRMPSDEKIRAAAVPVVTKLAAETILQNLKVLAVDQETDQQAEAKVVKTVTLQASPKEAETIVLALKMGTLSLVLRSLGDDSTIRSQNGQSPQTTTDLRVSGVMREIMKGENRSGSLSQVVRVYSGTRVENVEVRPYTSTQ